MKRRASVMLAALAVAGSTPSAVGHHSAKEPAFKNETFTKRVYPLLYAKAKKSKRVHAGRDVLRDGRARDGHFSHSLLRREARRLWVALHPGNEREHARRQASVSVVPAHLEAIAQCESGGDPTAISADGTYRGKWQFDQSTWESVGGVGDPAAASEAEQDKRALILYQQRGSAPWPTCGR